MAEDAPSDAEIFTRLHGLALGIDAAKALGEAETAAAAARLPTSFYKALENPAFAPRMPLVLPQLLRAINNEAVSRRELARIIVRDPALAGGLLKLANSAYYRFQSEPVESIDRAIALVGTDGMRSLITTSVMQPIFRVGSREFARFPEIIWTHTLRATSAIEALAAATPGIDSFAAQLLSMVRGMGTIVVFRVALDHEDVRGRVQANPEILLHLLRVHGADVARHIAVGWNLSASFVSCLDEQVSDDAEQVRTPLQQTLHLGRLMGALAVLEAHDCIDGEIAHAVMLESGCPAGRYEAIWQTMTKAARME